MLFFNYIALNLHIEFKLILIQLMLETHPP